MSVLTLDTGRPAISDSQVGLPRHVYLLSLLAAVTGGAAAALTYLLPNVLQGPPVTNGNARGTALVMLALATPALVLSVWSERQGSRRARFFWLGSLFYLGYNAFLLLFLTPFNSLFLVYVVAQSFALFSIFALVFASRHYPTRDESERIPVRGLAVFVWTIVLLNTLAWLQVVIPAVLSDDPGSFLDGLGVATNAIYVQDLTVWLPLMTLGAWWMWHRRPIGIFLTGSWLAFGFIEAIGIAVDQWFGHQADPLSPHASPEVIPVMIGLAVANLAGLFFYLRRQSTDSHDRRTGALGSEEG